MGGQAADAIPAAGHVMNLSNFGAFGSSTGGGALSPTWTLAVEEQFYLIWPVFLLVMLVQSLLDRWPHRWPSRPGRDLSYGMYLWHLPVFILLIPLVPSLAVRVPLTAALTVPRAYVSFRYVERFIRRWASARLEPDVVRPVPERTREMVPAGR